MTNSKNSSVTLDTPPRAVWSIHRILMVSALVLLVAYFIIYVLFAINLMQFPFDYDQGEGFELVDTILFSQGQWPYQDTNVFPFYSSNYPPIFHVIAAPFVWLFGPAYWYGRLLGFLGTLITAAAIGYAVYREGNHRWMALFSGLAFLASNTIYHIGPLFRQHMTMVMFETLSVVVLAYANEIEDQGKRRRTLFFGFALMIIAGYTKQLALASALAILAFIFIRQPRRAIIWGIGFAVVGVAIFLWMDWATQGQWWLQAITANVNDFIREQAIGLYRLWFSLHGFLLVPAILYAAHELYFRRLSIYTVWFAAAVINSALAGKWGAGDSYFATAIAAMCILSGIFASHVLNRSWTFDNNYLYRWLIKPFTRFSKPLATLGMIIIPLLYIGYGRAVLHMPTTGPIFEPLANALGIQANAVNGFYDSAGRIAGGYADIGHFTTAEDIAAGEYIVEQMRAIDGLVLSEEAGFNLAAGKEVITNPTQLLNLWLNGLFDPTALVEMINDQAFDLVVLRAHFYPTDVLIAITTHYEEREQVLMNGFMYQILEPRQTTE